MTLDEFAAVTQRVIERQGFEQFQPTAIYPARDHIRGGAAFPPLVSEGHVLDWAADDARDREEFLVALKVDDTHFTVIRRVGAHSEHQIYAAATRKA